jgi:hypothetical protein
MRTPRFVGRRVLGAVVTAALASTLLIGVGTVAATQPPRVTVCHLGTTGTISPITLSARGAAAHIAAGDYYADLTLAGKTVYGKAWTNVDGIPGYSVCDTLIGAFYEASGDGHLGAGDVVVVGSYPAAFEPPYDFGDVSIARTIVGVMTCTATDAVVDLGSDAVAEVVANPTYGQAFLYFDGIARLVFAEDGFAGGVEDIIHVLPEDVALERTDTIDQPFVEAAMSTGCTG